MNNNSNTPRETRNDDTIGTYIYMGCVLVGAVLALLTAAYLLYIYVFVATGLTFREIGLTPSVMVALFGLAMVATSILKPFMKWLTAKKESPCEPSLREKVSVALGILFETISRLSVVALVAAVCYAQGIDIWWSLSIGGAVTLALLMVFRK